MQQSNIYPLFHPYYFSISFGLNIVNGITFPMKQTNFEDFGRSDRCAWYSKYNT